MLAFDVNVQPRQSAGALLTLDVDVKSRALSAPAQLLSFDVSVQSADVDRILLGFDVHVMSKAPRWHAVVLLDGVDVSNRVLGTVSVGAQAGQNRTATFTMKNPNGVVDPLVYINKPLVIDYVQPDGRVNRVFTGFVETPTYSVETGRTQILASTLKDKRLDKMSRTEIDQLIGGAWSKHLFDEESEGAEYAADLLRTVEADLQVDAEGVIRVVPWAISSPDFVMDGSQISAYKLGVALQDAKSLVNKINVSVEYRYTRLRHREREYRWEAPGHNYWGDYMARPYPLVPKALVRSAVESTGWQLVGDINFQDIPAQGSYTVEGKSVVWLNAEPGKYTTAADWKLATRFTQTITEKFNLSFEAPESVEVWGEVPSSLRSHGVTAEYADDEWDNAALYSAAPEGSVKSDNGDWVLDATDVDEGGRDAFNHALQIILQMYKRELLNAHRKNYVTLVLPKALAPEIDVHHTVQLVLDEINCIGRVYSIDHQFDAPSLKKVTTIQLVLSRAPAGGAYVNTPLVAPSVPDVADQAITPAVIRLGVHLGNAYSAGAFDESWRGYVSNYKYYDQVDTLEQYPTAFIVGYPEIEDASRDERTAETDAAYTVLIPNDPLTLTNTRGS